MMKSLWTLKQLTLTLLHFLYIIIIAINTFIACKASDERVEDCIILPKLGYLRGLCLTLDYPYHNRLSLFYNIV